MSERWELAEGRQGMVQSLGAMGVWRVSKVQGQASGTPFEWVQAAEQPGGRLLAYCRGAPPIVASGSRSMEYLQQEGVQ